jgi:hypothetical protein
MAINVVICWLGWVCQAPSPGSDKSIPHFLSALQANLVQLLIHSWYFRFMFCCSIFSVQHCVKVSPSARHVSTADGLIFLTESSFRYLTFWSARSVCSDREFLSFGFPSLLMPADSLSFTLISIPLFTCSCLHICLFYSVTSIDCMDTPYVPLLLQLVSAHHHVSDSLHVRLHSSVAVCILEYCFLEVCNAI